MVDYRYDRVVESGDRAVQGPVNRVLEDRVTAAAGGPAGGTGGPGTGVAAPAIDPPLPIALDPWFTPDPALQSCLDKVRDLKVGNQQPFKSLRVVLVDMSESKYKPRYAAYNDRIQTQVDNLAHLGLLYAAFELRDLVQVTVSNMDPATIGKDVLKRIAAAWQPIWEKRFATRKSDSPQFDKILRAFQSGSRSWQVVFKRDLRNNAQIDAIAKAGTGETVDFRTRLALMMKWSDNAAARAIQRDLGFQYVNAILEDGGFFDANQGGLWLSKLYDVNEHWGGPDPAGGKTVQGATARALAELMTLIGQDRLPRGGYVYLPEIWDSMASSRSGPLGDGTWVATAIGDATDPDALMPPGGGALPKRDLYGWLSKSSAIGNRFGECALIERHYPWSQSLRYCVVVLGAPNATVIEQLAVKLDDCIRARNPPPPPPPPSPMTA